MSVTIDWNDSKVMAQIRAAVQEESLGIAKQIARQAVVFAPKETGSLAASISAMPSKFKNGGAIVAAGDSTAYYASFVELGTRRSPAFPFLRTATKLVGPVAIARFQRKLKRELAR